MTDSVPINVLEEPAGTFSDQVINLDLNVLGKPVRLRIGIKDQQARLADIVPVARILSSKIVQAKMDQLDVVGKSIPCQKGCAACCHTPVMLSVPEAIYLVESLTARVPPRQCAYFKESCDRVSGQIETYLPRDVFPSDVTRVSTSELDRFSDWYANSGLSCPFLFSDLCAIYGHRPIACRECFVIGPASQCQIDKASAIVKTIQGALSLRNVLMRLTSELTQADREGILMHNVFSWYKQYKEVLRRRWPAGMMVERFISIVKALADRDNTIRAEQGNREVKRSPGLQILDIRGENLPGRPFHRSQVCFEGTDGTGLRRFRAREAET